ncbi:MAG: tetratricopeptide repeat protein [Lachnospiraceae bacterium]|nr:tetratricopeptide repeat protein [Lachnospiraceae bacterium]
MKKQNLLAAAFIAVLLCTGCGAEGKVDNISVGMAAVENLQYEEALGSFEAALENREDERLIYRGMGIAYIGLTQYEDAIACLEKALQLSGGTPENMDFDINYYLATAYYRDGQPEKAVSSYDAILALRPKDVEAYYLRGCVKLYGGDYEGAKLDFDQVVVLAPNDYDRLIQIYTALLDNGYKDAGVEYLQSAVAANEKSISDYDLGRIYYYLEDYENAKLCLSKLKTASDYGAALFLGRTYEALGDYNYASSIYSDYVENDSTKPEIYNQLGLCRMQMGEYELALIAFQTGMNIEDNSMLQTLKFNEIVAYEYMQEYKTSAALMSDYLKSYPDDTAAQREYQFLKTR